jgi:hypothetical protein
MSFDIGITKPLTPDGMCGWNKYGTLMVWERDGDCMTGHGVYDVREFTCKICLQGWKTTADSLRDQYKNQYDEWIHLSCYVRYFALQDRDLFFSSLVGARIRFDGPTEMDSQYWCRDKFWIGRKWCEMKALDQPIKITMGSRKRVYSLQFEPIEGVFSDKVFESAKMEFDKEEVTKEFGATRILLHAWGAEKLRDYVKRLSNVFGLDKREETVLKV